MDAKRPPATHPDTGMLLLWLGESEHWAADRMRTLNTDLSQVQLAPVTSVNRPAPD